MNVSGVFFPLESKKQKKKINNAWLQLVKSKRFLNMIRPTVNVLNETVLNAYPLWACLAILGQRVLTRTAVDHTGTREKTPIESWQVNNMHYKSHRHWQHNIDCMGRRTLAHCTRVICFRYWLKRVPNQGHCWKTQEMNCTPANHGGNLKNWNARNIVPYCDPKSTA